MNSPGDQPPSEEQRRASQNWYSVPGAASMPQQPQQPSLVAVPPNLQSAMPSAYQNPAPSQNFVEGSSHQAASSHQATSSHQAASSEQMMQLIILMQKQISQLTLMQNNSAIAKPPENVLTSAPFAEQILDSLSHHIKEFHYEEEAKMTFASWFARYEDLFERDASRLDDSAKVRLLIRKLGAAEYERYANFILPKSCRDFSFSETIKKLSSLFGVKESLLHRRYKCLNLMKRRSEDYLAYSCRVNRACVDFEIGKLTEEQFKCLIYVCGLRDEEDVEIRTRLLGKIDDRNDTTLESLTADCQRILNLKKDSAMIEKAATEQVFAVQKKTDEPKFSERQNFQSRKHEYKRPQTLPGRNCWLCGKNHWARDCPFKSNVCRVCKKKGHRDGYCPKPKRYSDSPTYRNKFSSRVVSVNTTNVQQRRKYINIFINNVSTRLQFDTGSDITIINRNVWQRLGKPELKRTVSARTASGSGLFLLGEFEANVTIGSVTHVASLRVAQADILLLGTDLIDLFALGSTPMDAFCRHISSEDYSKTVERRFQEVFNGMGLCTKASVKLQLKENVRPVFCPKRPVAYAVQELVDKELDRLEQMSIISPTDYSEWAAPIVVVRKANGSIRLCGDYSTGLNDALQQHEYPLPLPEDIFARLSQCKIFSKIDLSDAFLQVEIDPAYRSLLTINTHRGLFTYNRLPPGIKIAPAAFQQLIDTMLAGVKGVSCYMDDIIVGGATEQEHEANLMAVLKRIQEYGFSIRSEKCAFKVQQLRYLGYIIDTHGLRPDPAKIDVIKRLPEPTDVSGVRSFLGAINYYARFVPNMRELRYPLDNLLKTNAQFRWTADCKRAFERFKSLLSSNLLLTHYDPRHKIIVSADASSIGIGATISHMFPNGTIRVVQHASRALTKTEEGYSQIDREGLAIIFAVTKFHKMIFGRRFQLQTDHRPLLRIFGSKKGIPVYTANRLQRFALTLLSYDFGIEYVRTESFGNADVLSRLINKHDKPDEDCVIASVALEMDVKSIATSALVTFPLSFREVARETNRDPIARKLHYYIKNGWPRNIALGADSSRYHSRKEDYSTVEGCILVGERVLIPEKLRKQCLSQLHRGHPGIQRMKAIARSYVFWPSLNEDIIDLVSNCHSCALAAKSPAHADPLPWPKTTTPWERVHVDYAGPIDGDYFLVVVDAHTKWPEIIRTASITARITVSILRGLFARFGMPTTLVSDNGTQFTSGEFSEFCLSNGVHHITSAPFHPQSNGQAERFVDTFKRSLTKIRVGGAPLQEALDLFLQTYRTTPNPQLEQNKTPAEVMFGRPIRTCFDLLRPPRKIQHDFREGNERSFERDDLVYAKAYSRNNWHWVPGRVIRKRGNVTYEVLTGHRSVIRHINQLKRRGPLNSQGPMTERFNPLPLDVLLDSWSIPVTPSVLPDVYPTQHAPPVATPTEPPSLPPHRSIPQHQRSPRRSSRSRRAPRRFDPYLRY
ncbi:uncharacterized protein K02A2.6-like [Anopheles merus]|uniref:uncharacterized protein K02A2.6-like n=2 Tax=Anopheles merus TaxID=30066 RepID=UPI001BE46479|nr:uncharacterized protein K02A2.6-like [Anopheles merus]